MALSPLTCADDAGLASGRHLMVSATFVWLVEVS